MFSYFASMGIYIFNWSTLRKYLIADTARKNSRGGIGTDIIPAMLSAGKKVYAWRFDDYWRDVGTVESFWRSNMDLFH